MGKFAERDMKIFAYGKYREIQKIVSGNIHVELLRIAMRYAIGALEIRLDISLDWNIPMAINRDIKYTEIDEREFIILFVRIEGIESIYILLNWSWMKNYLSLCR